MTAETTTVAARKEAPGIIKRSALYNVDPRAVTRNKPGFNPRFDFGDIEELAKSIKANGMLLPIRVQRLAKPMKLVLVEGQKDTYELKEDPAGQPLVLIDGARRMAAVTLLLSKGYEFPDGIPAILAPQGQSMLEGLFQMFESNSGKNFLPLEEAAAYKTFHDGDPAAGIKGLTIKQICERVGRKQVHVTATLALLDMDEGVQADVKAGQISKTNAKDIAVHARGDKAKQRELAALAKAAGKDRAKKVALKKAIDDSRRSKAASKGKTLKMRALSDAELSKLGQMLATSLADRMNDAGMSLDADIRAFIVKDDKLALAATFGALEALKAAAGMQINLEY